MTGKARITIRETGAGLGIYNPTRRKLVIVLFMALWLVGWTAGEFFALWALFTDESGFARLFLIVWLSAWTVGGLLAWSILLWQLFGVEKLFVTSGALVRETGFWFATRRKVYDLADIADMRERAARGVEARPGGFLSGGTIVFEVDGKQHSLGIQLDADERKAVLNAIRRYMPAGRKERVALASTLAQIAEIKRERAEASKGEAAP